MSLESEVATLRREVAALSWKLRLVDPSSTRGLSVSNIIGALALANVVTNEVPAGLINGLNTIYTLNFVPNPPGNIIVILSGLLQLFGTDYTLSGATLTFAVAPPGGSWLRAYYVK